MSSYRHLGSEERFVIQNLREEGKSYREIGEFLHRSASTIYREIKRNKAEHIWYKWRVAEELSKERRKQSKTRLLDVNTELRELVISQIREGFPPDTIAGRLKMECRGKDMRISSESIYSWIYKESRSGNPLYKYLKRGKKKRQKRSNKNDSKQVNLNKRSIHERPKEIKEARIPYYWEGDIIAGSNNSGYIATLIETQSKFLVAGLMKNKKADTCYFAIMEAFANVVNEQITGITFDNGSEFACFDSLEEALECKVYFADPHSPWQRGLNEHVNGMLRNFFPKKTSFAFLTQEDVDNVVNKINSIPRKSLGYKTPAEVFASLSNVALQT